MDPEGSLPCSQEPATSHRPEPDASIHNFLPHFPKVRSNIVLPSTPRSLKCFYLLSFVTWSLYAFLVSPMCATCSVHLTLLDLITLTNFETRHCAVFSSLPPGSGPIQPPIKLVPAAKANGAWNVHSPPSSTQIKSAWSYTSIPSYVFMT
jgi:hypothetical protein